MKLTPKERVFRAAMRWYRIHATVRQTFNYEGLIKARSRLSKACEKAALAQARKLREGR